MIATWWQGMRGGFRLVFSRPGFALAVVLTLALGIGANGAIFSVVKAVLLDALPYARPAELVVVAQAGSAADTQPTTIGYATFKDLAARVPEFSALAVMGSWQPSVGDGERAELIEGMRVSRGFFAMLGVTPILGRDFLPEEDQPDRRNVVLLGHGLWQRQFGADPAVVGRRIVLAGREYLVAGVLPASFRPPNARYSGGVPEIWMPLGYDLAQRWACRSCAHLRAIGRLAAGTTHAQAQAALDALAAPLRAAYPNDYGDGMHFVATPLAVALAGAASRPLWLLFAAVGLVLLLACVDVSGLLLVRAETRRHELSVRSALGARRARLGALLLGEATALALIGAVLGGVLAFAATRLLVALGPASIQRLDQTQVDLPVLGFTLLVALLAALSCGWLPAWRAGRSRAADALQAAARIAAPTVLRTQGVLVVVQIALAFALSLGALLMLRSYAQLIAVDPGFRSADVTTFKVAAMGPRYAQADAIRRFEQGLHEAIAALPGVQAVGATTLLPLAGDYDRAGFHVQDSTVPAVQAPEFDRNFATAGYLEAMGIPVLQGRGFTADDAPGRPPVALVSASLARTLWPGASALGQRIQLGARDDAAPWATVVGVVGDVRVQALDAAPAPQAYLVAAQQVEPPNSLGFAVRSTLPPDDLLRRVRSAVASLDPAAPVYDAATLQARRSDALARQRFALTLYGLFAATALLLACIGVYGIVAYALQGQTRAIGLRRALGAGDGALLRVLSRDALRRGALGLGAGLLLALGWVRLLASELYGVSPYDPASYGAVGLVLALVVAAAIAWPLRRALRLEPMAALRDE